MACFLDRRLCPGEHIAFSRRFGELLAHVTRPEFIYRHRWKAGDLRMRDNCSTQHRAAVDYELPQRRLMERTALRGTAPF